METCENRHEKIVYDEYSYDGSHVMCPVCIRLKELDDLKSQHLKLYIENGSIEFLKSEIIRLQFKIINLEADRTVNKTA